MTGRRALFIFDLRAKTSARYALATTFQRYGALACPLDPKGHRFLASYRESDLESRPFPSKRSLFVFDRTTAPPTRSKPLVLGKVKYLTGLCPPQLFEDHEEGLVMLDERLQRVEHPLVSILGSMFANNVQNVLIHPDIPAALVVSQLARRRAELWLVTWCNRKQPARTKLLEAFSLVHLSLSPRPALGAH